MKRRVLCPFKSPGAYGDYPALLKKGMDFVVPLSAIGMEGWGSGLRFQNWEGGLYCCKRFPSDQLNVLHSGDVNEAIREIYQE